MAVYNLSICLSAFLLFLVEPMIGKVLLLYGWAMANGSQLGIPLQVIIFALVLFVGCMISHGELYSRRPHPQRLPAFYTTVSAGGALGGILITFIAPALFKGFWELPLGLVLFCALLLVVGRSPQAPGLKAKTLARISTTLLAVSVLVTGVRAFLFIGADLTGSIRSQRNFCGVVRLRQVGAPGDPNYSYQLIHGNTVHGAQFLAPGGRDIPTVYYGPQSGIGLPLLSHPRNGLWAAGRGARSGHRDDCRLRTARRPLPLLRDQPAGHPARTGPGQLLFFPERYQGASG